MIKIDLIYDDDIIDSGYEKEFGDIRVFMKRKSIIISRIFIRTWSMYFRSQKNFSGDIYGWLIENGTQTDIVVMCDNDDGESIIYAEDISAAIFRRII